MALRMMIVTTTLALFVIAPSSASSSRFDNQIEDVERECKTINNMDGICVPYTSCDASYVIVRGGVIHTSEFRSMTDEDPFAECGPMMWCCTKESLPSPKTKINGKDEGAGDCLSLDSDKCDWCAKLYKVSDLKYLDTGMYCAGALISPQVILTSGSCLKAAQKFTIYASIPFSADQDKKYIAKDRKIHPQYNTGTHHYDFGFVLLEEKVVWGTGVTRGACLNFDTFGANCLTFGFDKYYNFASTIIEVSPGACSNMGGGGSSEVYCGENKDESCFAAQGAPVICNTRKGNELLGVVRSACVDNNISIGSISMSEDWLVKELQNMTVPKDVYYLF